MDIEARLESMLRAPLERIATTIRGEFTTADVRVHSSTVGRATGYHAYRIGVECTLREVMPDQPDLVAIDIGVRHTDRQAELDAADVVWGAPSGYCEVSLISTPEPATEERIAQLTEEFVPRLAEALRQALARGRPPG
jgi:hypothetical protein